MRFLSRALAALTLAACGGETTVVVSSADALREALDGATSGTVVQLSAGTYAGSFTVPAGVRIEGAGVDLVEIVAPTDLDALRVTGGADVATHVGGLSIAIDGGMGVRAIGGRVELVDVSIRGPRGAAAGFADAEEVSLTRVRVEGPVTEANAMSLPPMPTPDVTLTHGIVLLRVARAALTDLEVRGTAHAGLLVVDSGLAWTGGRVEEVLGSGAIVVGGTATIAGLTVDRVLRGVGLVPAYALALVGGEVATTDLVVTGSDDVGVLQSEGRAAHDRVDLRDNAYGGLWTQLAAATEVRGGSLEGNGLVGVHALDVDELTLDDLAITGTLARTRVVGAGSLEVGDAIQVVRPTRATLGRLTLADSARVGLLADGGGGSLAGVSILDSMVSGTGAQLGAIAQNGDVAAGWDAGLARDPVTTANDAAFAGELGILGVVAPTEVPTADALRTAGLDAVVAPTE